MSTLTVSLARWYTGRRNVARVPRPFMMQTECCAPVHRHFEGASKFSVAPKVGWLRKFWIQFLNLMSSLCEISLHGNVLLQEQKQTRRILISGCNVLDRVRLSPWAKFMPNLVLFQRKFWHLAYIYSKLWNGLFQPWNILWCMFSTAVRLMQEIWNHANDYMQ